MLDKIIQRSNQVRKEVQKLRPQINQLSKMNIPLDHDPISKGLNSFNQKLADIQRAKDLTCELMFRVINLKNSIENMQIKMEKYIIERKSEVLDSNPDIQDLKNQAMRDLALEKPLKVERDLWLTICQLVTIIKGYHETVKSQLSNLESTNNNIKKQLEVVDQMITIGEITTKFNNLGRNE